MKNLVVIVTVGLFLTGCATTSKFSKEQIQSGSVEVVSTFDDSSLFRPAKQSRSIQAAFNEVKELIKKDPNNAQNFSDAAQLYIMMGDNDKAIEFAKRSIRLDLDKADNARKILAQAYLRKGNKDLALIILNSLGGEESKDGEIHNMLGLVALRNNERTLAMSHLKKSLELDPNIVSARMNLGLVYLKYQQLDSAEKQFKDVLVHFPGHADAKLHLAIIDSQMGRYKQALAVFNDTLENDPDNAVALYNLAVLNNNTKQYGEALANLRSYLKTRRARTNSTEPAFALLEDIKLNIQKQQEAVAKANQKDGENAPAKNEPVRPVDSTLGH